MTSLLDPITLRDLTLDNRIVLPPMCQYQAVEHDGVPTDWHLVHYGARATGGFGLIIAEATGVLPEGRITPDCTGIWNDDQRDAWTHIVGFCHQYGAAMGIQLAHAGRKASTYSGFDPAKSGSVPRDEGGWETYGPSAIPFPGLATPTEADTDYITSVVAAYAKAAQRADEAGFDVVEVHAAHGYLISEFLSPLSNHRTDSYGGDFAGRTKLLLEVVDAIREVWPEGKPLFVRISATEWADHGWSLEDSVRLAPILSQHGVDVIHVSSGGNVIAHMPTDEDYQIPLASAVRAAGVRVCAVGRITDPLKAQTILDEGHADLIAVGRVALREPSWPLRAAAELEMDSRARYPDSYLRGRWPAVEPVR
jgi:2,4-dienoyl-CoA reductase-like NADH-dependent reductase (Old Yellow Enzyme family)